MPIKKFNRSVSVFTFLVTTSLVFSGFSSEAIAQEKEARSRGLGCAFVGPIQSVYFNQHINYSVGKKKKKILLTRAEVEKRTIEQYIKKLDGSKLYLFESDVAKIRKSLSGILSKIEKRPKPDCSALTKVQDVFIKRVKQRVEFAKKYLGKKFKFQENTKLVLDPDKRNYARNKKQAEAFQKKYLQFQVSNFLATDLELKEAKARVIRRYERNLRRVLERGEERILSSYLDAFARSLDPHSSYFSADMMEDFRISMALSLEGIGATLTSQDGFTVIEQLIPGGAAARDGQLRPKDKIVAVGQGECPKPKKKEEKKKAKKKVAEKKIKVPCEIENVVEMDLRDVVKKIRGKKGSKVRLSILRKDAGKTEKFVITLVRDKVKLEDEAASITYIDREFNGKKFKVGLINLPSFYSDSRPGGRTAATDVKKLLKEARKKKVDSIVLDFSSNGGGSLDDAVKIAGLFFKTGAVVKQSAKKGKEMLLSDEDSDVDFSGPLVVLTSRISASASEIVAGTLQDYNRAVVVGSDHTFGKGSVQSVIPLPAGLGASKVTVGMFYTPGGNSTQHRGVDADIILPSTLSTNDIGEKTLDYSLPPSTLASFLSPTAYVKKGNGAWTQVTDNEIKKLRSLSEIRVENSAEFKKILDDIKKNEEKASEIEISQSFKERTENKKKEKEISKDKFGNRTKDEKMKEYLERADVQEAVNVAVDLTAMRKGIEIKLGAKIKEKSKPQTTP